MLPKRQKLVQTTALADVNTSGNHSIVSMFARCHSRNHFQNLLLDSQCAIDQTANLSQVADRPRLDNRLSLSLRRKRICTTDAVIDLTDDADNNNTADISEPRLACPSADSMADTATDVQNHSHIDSSLLLNSYQDDISPDISAVINQQRCANFTVSEGDARHLSQEMSSYQNDASIFGENSMSDPSPERQTAIGSDVAYRMPYYLENFLLALNSVFSDTFYAELFNNDDLSAWHTFQDLNGNCFS